MVRTVKEAGFSLTGKYVPHARRNEARQEQRGPVSTLEEAFGGTDRGRDCALDYRGCTV